MHRAWIGLGIFIFLTGSQSAWPQPSSPPPPDTPVINEVIDVRVVNVEAVVTGKDGKPVRGLGPADFRLLVDGREVPIDYFSEVADGVAAPPPAAQAAAAGPASPVEPAARVGRSYLVFIDESFAVAKLRDRVVERLAADLRLLGPDDQMAVLAFDGERITVLSPWSADGIDLSLALEVARRRPTRGNQLLAAERSRAADLDFSVEAVAEVNSEKEIQTMLREPMGRRDNPEARTQLGRTAAAMAGALRGFETPPGRKVMILLSGGWSLQVAPRLFGPVVEAANRLGYTLYPVDVAQGDAQILRGFDLLASTTGGRVANSARESVLSTVAADSGTYYWLGFTPAWKGDDRGHTLVVEARRPGLVVRARRGFSDVSQRTEATLRAESVLLFGGAREEKRIQVEVGEVRPVGRRGREVEVDFIFGVPVKSLAFQPAKSGSGYVAEVPVGISSLDEKGGRAELPNLRMLVPVEQVPVVGHARCKATLKLRRVAQRLVFTVPDAVRGTVLWGEAQLSF
jgi:VWFA-related protein